MNLMTDSHSDVMCVQNNMTTTRYTSYSQASAALCAASDPWDDLQFPDCNIETAVNTNQGCVAVLQFLTLMVVKKNSPGESCRKRTPCCATGASRKTTKSFEKAKHVSTAVKAARAATMTRSLSSSRWSQIGIEKSSGRSSGSG